MSAPPPAHGAAYEGAVFGPFAGQGKQHPITRSQSGTIDVRGFADWTMVYRVETDTFRWGHLVITGEADAGGSIEAGGTALSIWPWIEVRVLAYVGGVGAVWFEGAVGNHDLESASLGGGEGTSPGPIVLPFELGEVPDALEVFARPRAGSDIGSGVAQLQTVQVVSRFRS